MSIHDPEPHAGRTNWREAVAERLTYPYANRTIIFNRSLKRQFCLQYRLSDEEVDVVRLGIYDIFREWTMDGATDDGRTVLFFGRLSAYKGLDVFYEAATQVAERIPGVHFIVAGRASHSYDPPRPPTLPRGCRIEVIDRYITNTHLAWIFRRASAVACPYVQATQSGVILTSYAFGKPVVATRVGGLPEYVKDGVTGILIPPGDSEALACALVELLGNEHLRRRLVSGIEGLRRTGDLCWHRSADQLLASYTTAAAT